MISLNTGQCVRCNASQAVDEKSENCAVKVFNCDSDDEEECGDGSTPAAQIPAHKRAAEASRPEADPNSQALPVPTKPVGTLACQLTAVQVLEKVASAERCTVAELRAYFEECKSQAGREVHGAAECDGELERLRQLAQDIQAAHA